MELPRCTDPIPEFHHRQIVRRMALDGCKWDPQIGDVATLTPFALILSREEWACLAQMAEALARELQAIEDALARQPALWPRLGLPVRVRRALEADEPWTPAAARAMRFDFHPAADGWRVSEVNSDVPGGYNEASPFTDLMAAEFSGLHSTGDPMAALAEALAAQAREPRRVALIVAAGLQADQQVVAGLAQALHARGCEALMAKPEQLAWIEGHAHLIWGDAMLPVGAILRFFQGEWLTRLRSDDWRHFFRGGLTPVCNPGTAVLSESKRLPLIWPELGVPTPTWSRLLPTTREVSTATANRDWILKAAYANTGDTVLSPAWPTRPGLGAARFQSWIRPRKWLAQRRFESSPLATPLGPMHACLGVYTVDGRAAGIYGRLSTEPVIDYLARDVAVLVNN